MLESNHLIGFGAGGGFTGAPISVSLVDSDAAASGGSPYTFSAMALGADAEDRIIAVAVAINGSSVTLSSATTVTIAGVVATAAKTTTGSSQAIGIFYAHVPSGASGDVVVTTGGTPAGCKVVVLRLAGGNNQVSDTGADAAIATSITLPADVVAGGALVAVSCNNGSKTCAWTKATEVSDSVYDSSYASSVAANATATTATINVTATFSGSTTAKMIFAVFR